jgi:type III pantothenate kinase
MTRDDQAGGGEITEIPNVLACDVGNHSVHFAHVCGDDAGDVRTMPVGRLAGLGAALAELWDEIPQPRKLVACSVNPAALKALEAAADERLGQAVLVVGRDLPLPMPTELTSPQSVGTDRLCAAVAAYDRLGTACVVADFGTAITIDCVSPEGVFLGGAILPGLNMQAAALHEKTAQLPQVQLQPVDWVFGRDTTQAIVGGILAAASGALRELVESYATALGQWPTVIATGGDAELVRSRSGEGEIIQAVVPDLTIRGAALAYYNSLLKKQ